MATHSGILAWEIPWRSLEATVHRIARVGHDVGTKPPAMYFPHLVI